jgi:glutamate formiminotransferase / 5-formyltetrahydrofolate cyclo-ligase
MIVESIPNVSEGRRADVIARMSQAIGAVPGARLLDASSDSAHNRSVFTLAGTSESLTGAVEALTERAVADIDLRTHRGEHPRMGAVDVIPFVPIEGATMDDCVALARRVGRLLAERFALPVYLYEAAATRPHCRNLADIRRGGFEGLTARMANAEWAPDFGPPHPHPTAGATAVGARMPLVAFNVNLATDRLDVAKRIAVTVREKDGGLPSVKAMGVNLADRGIVQVSMNLTNYQVTAIHRAFEAVRLEAAKDGIEVVESEIVGLVPAAALRPGDEQLLRLAAFDPAQILERRLGLSTETPD